MECLPRDVLTEITDYLRLIYVARLAQTNRFFNLTIWKCIRTLRLSGAKTKKLGNNISIRKFHNLEELCLQPTVDIFPLDLESLTTLQILEVNAENDSITKIQALTNLRELSIRFEKNNLVGDLLNNFAKLTGLKIDTISLKEANVLSWEALTKLESLSLCQEDESYQQYYIQNLWKLTRLKRLSLNALMLDQDQSDPGISNLTNLESLAMISMKTKNNGWVVDYNQLADLKKLTKLYFSDVTVDYDPLTKAIAKLTQLRQLNLLELFNEIDGEPYSSLTNLTGLYLGVDLNYGDPGPEFQKMTGLVNLSIQWCRNITQLTYLQHLTDLTINGTDLVRKVADLLFLTNLTTLRQLKLYSFVNLPKHELDDLRKRLSFIPSIFIS